MSIDEQIAQAVAESHPHDLSTIRHYIAWVKFRRKIHSTFYDPDVHWIRPDPKPFPPMPVPALPILQERRRAYRVKFNAHWLNH